MLDSPLEALLIDGNFDPVWTLHGMSISDWLCLRVESSFWAGVQDLCPECNGRSSGCRYHCLEARDIILFIAPAFELIDCTSHVF